MMLKYWLRFGPFVGKGCVVKFSVRTKLFIAFGAVLLLLVGTTVTGFIGLRDVVKNYDDLSGRVQYV